MEPCPADSTNRSRSGQSGCCGSNLRNLVQSTVATSAMPIGMPRWPDLACSTASMASTRMALASDAWLIDIRDGFARSCNGRRAAGPEMPATWTTGGKMQLSLGPCLGRSGCRASRLVSTRTSKVARRKDVERTMSAVNVAEQRAWSALQRLEQAMRGDRSAGRAEEQATLERDCELLRQECDSLRRELASMQQHRERAAGVVAEVEGRLD